MARPRRNPLQLVFSLPRFYAGLMYFVDSTYGSNEYIGTDQNRPVRSITYAMTKCVDDHDDVIVVLNGYDNDLTDAETNGDDTPIILNKNGVTVLFSGRNNKVRAIEADDSIFQITCNQGTIGIVGELITNRWGAGKQSSGIMIVAAKAGTAATVVEVVAASVDAEVFGFYTDSCDGYDELITVNDTAHRANIHHNSLIGDATDTDEGIIISGTNQESVVHHNTLISCGLGTNGAIAVVAAAVMVELSHNIVWSETASEFGIKCHASATGHMVGNLVRTHNSDTANGCVMAKGAFYENYTPVSLLKSGAILPAIA